MRTIIFVFLLLNIIICSKSIAQTNDIYPLEEITIRRSFLFGPKYFQGGNRLRAAELKDTLRSNSKAYKIYKTTIAPKAIGNLFSFAGGFLLGWQLAEARKQGGGDVTALLASGALILSGAAFDSYANQNRKVAIKVYNKGLNAGSMGEAINLSFKGNGLCLSF